MRRPIVAVCSLAAVTLAVAAVAYGPMAWDAWRFSDDIRERRLQAGGPQARGAAIAVTCNHCHGENGNSRSDVYPALAGLPADYLLGQLKDFASGRRESPHMRPLAIYLPQADLEAISVHYAKQSVELPPQDSAAASSAPASTAAAAARLQACTGCHGTALQGATVAPRLAGQGASYLLRQIEAFRAGARKDASGAMAAVAQALNPAELEDLAKAASALRSAAP